ncbi:MAG: type II toxin-antitoxin system RelE/ParE family toxin [Clostridiales bacterium]|nr:type II toxin-antitoxin system RelE/ParE family toxin [Clostridiales bacterium]
MSEIRDYIAYQFLNPSAARNLIEEIRAAVLKLNKMPQRYRPIDEKPWGDFGVRKLMVKNFYVYYWIEEETAIVHITAVTYAMRDQINVLTKMNID